MICKTHTAFGIKCKYQSKSKCNSPCYLGETSKYHVIIYVGKKYNNIDNKKYVIELALNNFNYYHVTGTGNTLKEAMTDVRNQFEALTGEFSALSEDISDRTWKVCN